MVLFRRITSPLTGHKSLAMATEEMYVSELSLLGVACLLQHLTKSLERILYDLTLSQVFSIVAILSRVPQPNLDLVFTQLLRWKQIDDD